MPEILEAQAAREALAAGALHREIVVVHAPDAWFLKDGLTPRSVGDILAGARFVAARRRGKLILLDTAASDSSRAPGPTVGLHLGMSGRVIVDGVEAGDPLVYASNADVEIWRRFGVSFVDGGTMWLRDPRRLGSVRLDPDENALGPDAFDVRVADVVRITERSRAPIKALLMNQSKIAGLGNLLVDEVCWRAGVDPRREARSLDHAQRRKLARAIADTLRILGRRGGSHTGDLTSIRAPGAACPRDGTPLDRCKIGGRTTFWCPSHQL